ncbi:MAG: hypothetical protein AB8C84_07745 [Oligoflexales bacterium]
MPFSSKRMKPYRVKVRSCIRENTYKYFLEKEECQKIWGIFCKIYGEEKIFPYFFIRQIENTHLILRYLDRDSSITVIEKEIISDHERNHILQLMGVQQ